MPPPSASDAPDARLIARFRADLVAAAGGAFVGGAPIALAVSGGGDSMAMLALAHAAFPGAARAVTFDHGLRAGSAAEAATVAAWCADRAVPHVTLRPPAPLATAGVQAAAREARYAAMARWAAAAAIPLLATAHHADDQAETVLMRGNRGSGLAGLAGIRRRRMLDAGADHPPLALVRPLLGWRRAELAAVAAAAGIVPVVDPSNEDDRYDRARLRKRLASADWLDPLGLGRSARALADAEEALAWSVTRLAGERCVSASAGLHLDTADLPFELVRRLVLHALARVDPAAAPPAGPALVRFCTALAAGRRAMLGAVLATPRGAIWHFTAAPPRSR